MQTVMFVINKYGLSMLRGAGYSLLIAAVGTVIGCLIGFAVGILQTIPVEQKDGIVKKVGMFIVKLICTVYVEVFRGTPMMVQAVFIYYGATMLFGIHMGALSAGFFIVSINTGAYIAESVRGGIISVDPGQVEGAKSIGMNHFKTMLYVVFPQALRNIMPQIGNNFIINVKDTSVMFIIGFPEFFAAHRATVGASYLYFPSATVEMVGYLTMTLLASFLLRWLERRLDGSSSYELVQEDQLVMTAGTYSHPDRGTPFDERSKEYSKQGKEEE
jgi:putative lysine transport system permease protein